MTAEESKSRKLPFDVRNHADLITPYCINYNNGERWEK